MGSHSNIDNIAPYHFIGKQSWSRLVVIFGLDCSEGLKRYHDISLGGLNFQQSLWQFYNQTPEKA